MIWEKITDISKCHCIAAAHSKIKILSSLVFFSVFLLSTYIYSEHMYNFVVFFTLIEYVCEVIVAIIYCSACVHVNYIYFTAHISPFFLNLFVIFYLQCRFMYWYMCYLFLVMFFKHFNIIFSYVLYVYDLYVTYIHKLLQLLVKFLLNTIHAINNVIFLLLNYFITNL